MPLDGLAALRAALTPLPVPWGVGPGLRAAVAAGLVLGGSLLVADLTVGGIAYLGVACAVSFVGRGDYRSRAANVGAQAIGAAVGMTVGALVPDRAAWVVGAAVVVGVLAGMVGRIGPASTAGAVMAVIGVAYTQFGRLAMPWWEPVLAYLVGSALVLALSLAGAAWHRDRYRRAAVSAVFEAAADLAESDPGATAEEARHRLALASAAARQAVAGYRLRPVSGPLHAAWSAARDAAAIAAERSVPPPFARSGAVPSPESAGNGGDRASGSAAAGVVSASDWAGRRVDSAPRSGGAPGAAENGGDQTSDVAEIARETAPGSGGGAAAGLARAGAGGGRGEPAAADRVDGWRRRAREVRAGDLGRFPTAPPVPPRPVRSVLRRATST